jgi:hypothetical protein
MIKALVKLLIKQIKEMNTVFTQMNWTPLPSENGPEGGTEIATFIKNKIRRSKIERRIFRLIAKQQSAKRQIQLSKDDSLKYSDFAISEFQNTERLFTQELKKLQSQRDKLIKGGSQALQTIEYIVGEVSGFGLIDILAVYTALWAIDINVLIGLLDEDAFRRLYDFNPELRTPEVRARKDGGKILGSDGNPTDVIQLMGELEDQVVDILSFTDRAFEFMLGNRTQTQTGDIPRS